MLEPAFRSFVGQYPIPIVHGLTVGELARMIQGERWLDGLEALELSVVEMQGWRRSMRWPQTQREWVATSPNIPSFEAALVYPGIGIVGEAEVSEGRGTPTPFSLFAAPWLDAARTAKRLNALGLPGVRFETATFKPRSIPGVAAHPRFEGTSLQGVRVVVADVALIEPLEIGMHALAAIAAEARAKGVDAAVRQPQDAARHRRHPAPARHARRRPRRHRHHRHLASRGRAVQGQAGALPAVLSAPRGWHLPVAARPLFGI